MTKECDSRLSPTEKTDIWSRWKSGQSLHEIGRAYGKPHNSIRCLLLLSYAVRRRIAPQSKKKAMAHWRRPRPWRSEQETRVVRCLARPALC